MKDVENKLHEMIYAANSLQCRINELKSKGIDIGSVLVNQNSVSVSVKSGIEKTAGIMGAELLESPSGVHLCIGVDGIHFGQKKKGAENEV